MQSRIFAKGVYKCIVCLCERSFYASFNENRKNEKFRLLNTFFPLWLARTHTHYTRHPQYYFGVMTSLLIFSLYVLCQATGLTMIYL